MKRAENNVNSELEKGEIVLILIAHLESAGYSPVYLRNHSNLPKSIGNDVDLLISGNNRRNCEKVLTQRAMELGWRHLYTTEFGPLAIYLAHPKSDQTIHFDIFDRIDWHFLEYANADEIRARRRWTGLVHAPYEGDEIFLNLLTRLIYQGKIRENHATQAALYTMKNGCRALQADFEKHLGCAGKSLFARLKKSDWKETSGMRKHALMASFRSHGLSHPIRLASGLYRYFSRSLRKCFYPPGVCIVLVGADGVDKSTVLKAILPWSSEWCGGRDTKIFQWNPVKIGNYKKGSASHVGHRGNSPRSPIVSLVYLVCHLIAFWWVWLFRIRPALSKSHCVVGDHYSYDLFLDPSRFSLDLPPTLLRIASLITPRPNVTIGLITDPETIRARNLELSTEEVFNYQERWKSIADGNSDMVTVSADATPEEVILAVKRAILETLCDHAE
jgi:thymidylate kinase